MRSVICDTAVHVIDQSHSGTGQWKVLVNHMKQIHNLGRSNDRRSRQFQTAAAYNFPTPHFCFSERAYLDVTPWVSESNFKAYLNLI